MWRGKHLGGGVFDGTARLVIYSYQADRPDNIGLDHQMGEFHVPIGEWFDVVYEIESNSSIRESDGSMRAWVNGELLLDKGGVQWQAEGGVPSIDTLYYSSFYGGSNSGWAPDDPTYARVKDVCWSAVVDGYSGIDPDNGRINVDASALANTVFNDGGAEDVAPWLTTQKAIAAAAEEASLYVEVMAEESSTAAHYNYSNVISNIGKFVSEIRAVTAQTLPENPLISARAALDELALATSLSTVSDLELEEAVLVTELIEKALAKSADLAIIVAGNAQATEQCEIANTDSASCAQSHVALEDAQEAGTAANSDQVGDSLVRLWHAEQAWLKGVQAIRLLATQ